MKKIILQGQEIEIRKLGAYSMIQCLDAVQRIIGRIGLARLTAVLGNLEPGQLTDAQIEKLTLAIQGLFSVENMNDLIFILEKATSITREHMEADGVDAIEIGSVIKALRAAWDYNELQRQFTEMGNELLPPAPPDAGGAREPELLHYPFSMHSPAPMDGLRETLTLSALQRRPI